MVSVIIPVYNVEKYIARCLESVINQTYRDLEIIVVNDATPDNSMAIVGEYASKDNRIRIVNNPRNMGLMMTRKNGYTIAKGDYFTFVDSDDTIPAIAVETLLKTAIDTGCDIVAGQIQYIFKDGNTEVWRCDLPFGNDAIGVYTALLDGHFKHNLVAKLYKRALFIEQQYPSFENMTNAEDACLFYSIVKNINSIEIIDDIVYIYYQNTGSSSQKRLSLQQLDSIAKANKVRLECCSLYPELHHSLQHFVTNVIFNFNRLGYSRIEIDTILDNNGLKRYGKLSNAIQYMTTKELLQFAKGYIISKLRR